jgi:hypothetical protein
MAEVVVAAGKQRRHQQLKGDAVARQGKERDVRSSCSLNEHGDGEDPQRQA